MIAPQIKARNTTAPLRDLRTLKKQVSPEGRRQLLAFLGHRMAFTRIPQAVARNLDGWPSPSRWPRIYRQGGQPLRDSGRLLSALAYNADEKGVRIGTNLPYGKALQNGMTITPRRGKWLLIALAPPLSISEVRTFPTGKAAIQAKYPGSFFHAKGPDGPGVYRTVNTGRRSFRIARLYGDKRSGQQIYGKRRIFGDGRSSGLERIAAAARKVKLRRYDWLRFRPGDLLDCLAQAKLWLKTGSLPLVALSGGKPEGSHAR